MEIKRKWIFFFLLVGGVAIQESSACFCWDQLNSTMRNLIPVTGAPVPDLPVYNYLGLEMTSTGAFKNCICSDVLHIRSTFDISDDSLYNATNINTTDSLEVNITNTLRLMLKEEIDANNVVGIEAMRNRSSALTYPDTQWIIDIVLKGRIDQANRITRVETLIKENSEDNTDGTYNFGGLADINGAEIKFTALTCLNSPPAALVDGLRIWTSALKYPGASAKYTCNAGFFITGVTTGSQSAVSTCLHSTLMWTELSSTIACEKGCQGSPPEPPFFVSQKWDPTMRKEGDEVLYVCINDYRSKLPDTLPNTTSTCENSVWTALDVRFQCEQILCTDPIPQLPSFSRTNWDGLKRNTRTEIVYSCKKGYKSKRGTVTVMCLEQGKWEALPKDFACFNKYDDHNTDDFQPDYSDYDMSKLPQEDLFLIVTIPAIICLIIVIFCCFCCCRIDSYLFIVCTGNARKTNYIHE